MSIGAGPGDPSLVKVVDATRLLLVRPDAVIDDAALLAGFLAFGPFLRGGVFVASGLRAGVVGPDGVIANTALLGVPQPFGLLFNGGVRVGRADLDGDGRADLLTTAALEGQHRLEALSGALLGPFPDLALLDRFFAYEGFARGSFVSGA
jgi:hypothetical protein